MKCIFIANWLSDKILDGIASFFYYIFLLINSIVYSFISFAYQIFLVLANGGQIFDGTIVKEMVNRLYIILSVIAMFLIAYSLLKSMINPDEGLKGKKSPANFIKDILISVAAIALVPSIFGFAFDLQSSLLVNNTIGKIIVGPASGDADIIRDGGYGMSATVWQTFIRPQYNEDGKRYCDYGETEEANDCVDLIIDEDSEKTYQDYWDDAKERTSFWALTDFGKKIVSGDIQYLFIVDTIAGVVVLVMLLGFNLDMAVRVVKLAAFEIMAPIPLLARLLPGEQGKKVFNNWLKATISTFVEAFIYVAFLYFAVILIATVSTSLDNFFTSGNATNASVMVKLFARCLIIIGIIIFTKQAPALLKEITGLDSGKYSPLKSIAQLASLAAAPQAIARNWNAKDADGNKKTLGKRFRSALAGGLSATGRAAWGANDVKNLKDAKANRKKAAEEAVKKRIARENAKKEKEQWRNAWNANPDNKGKKPVKDNLAGTLKYKAAMNKLRIDDWAGVNAVDELTLKRRSEFTKGVQDTFRQSVEAWKTDPYKEAKKLSDNATGAYKAIDRDLIAWMKENGIDFKELSKQKLNEYATSQGKTAEELTSKEKRTIEDNLKDEILASHPWERKDEYYEKKKLHNDLAGQKLSVTQAERKKKAEPMAQGVRRMLLDAERYPDMAINLEDVFKRMPERSDAMREAYEYFKDVTTNKDKMKELVDGFKAEIGTKEYNMSDAMFDFLDEYQKEAANVKANLEFQQKQRESTFKSDAKDDK